MSACIGWPQGLLVVYSFLQAMRIIMINGPRTKTALDLAAVHVTILWHVGIPLALAAWGGMFSAAACGGAP